MTPGQLKKIEQQLHEWPQDVFEGMGRRERREALVAYLRGLLLEGERKSIEPIAARLVSDASETDAMRQRIQQAISVAAWDEEIVFRRIAERAECDLPALDAYVLDDTGFPKKGFKSVGVQRQYSGTMGRIDNCQIATRLHLASEHGGVCIGMRLYLPKDWAADPKRRARTGIPDDVQFEEKWRIGLRLLDAARGWALADRVVVADAGYGDCVELREQLQKRGMHHVLGVTGTAVAWPPGVVPIPPPTKRTRTNGRPPSRWRDPENGKAQLTSEILAQDHPARRNARPAVEPLRCRPDPHCASPHDGSAAERRALASVRVASHAGSPEQALPLEPARDDVTQEARVPGEAPLADRA